MMAEQPIPSLTSSKMPTTMPVSDTVTNVESVAPQSEQVDIDKPILTLSRNITVRPHRHSDAEMLNRHGNNLKISQNMRNRWPEDYTIDRCHNWIARSQDTSLWIPASLPEDKNGTGAGLGPGIAPPSLTPVQLYPATYVVAQDDRAIGGIGMIKAGDTDARTMSIGYWLGEDFWGQGILTEVLKAMVQWIWKTLPYICKLEVHHYGWNPASGRVMEKAGFVKEGVLKAHIWKRGKCTDVHLYGMVREGIETTSEPPPLLTTPEILANSASSASSC